MLTGIVVFCVAVLSMYAALSIGMWYGKTRENKRIYDNIRTLVSNINDPRKISVINDLVRFAIPDSLQDAEVNTFSKRHTITKESVLRRHQEIEEWNQEP